jgi:uncharacterized repeat protein (TIGR01451 family)
MIKELQSGVRFALALGGLFILTVGAIFRVEQMYLMALALWLLPAAAWLVGRTLAGGVVCVRSLPALSASGETVTVTLTVTNVAPLTRPALRVSDALPRGLRAVGERAPILLNLRPGEARAVTYLLVAERRGRHPVGPARVESADPLGLWSFVRGAGTVTELAVYPTPLPLRRVFWEDAAVSGVDSQEAAQRRGSGMEFHGVREYQPGDELRHVHWRTTARRGTLSVAEYAQGASRDTVLALDLSRSAYADTGADVQGALECAVTLAASAAAYLLRRGHAVRLLTPLDRDDPAPPSAGPATLPRLLETLVGVEADSSVSLAETLARAGRVMASGATLVCITPRAADPALRAALSESAARGASVFGLAMDTFAPAARAGGDDPPPPGLWMPVRRGDDLAKVLEG